MYVKVIFFVYGRKYLAILVYCKPLKYNFLSRGFFSHIMYTLHFWTDEKTYCQICSKLNGQHFNWWEGKTCFLFHFFFFLAVLNARYFLMDDLPMRWLEESNDSSKKTFLWLSSSSKKNPLPGGHFCAWLKWVLSTYLKSKYFVHLLELNKFRSALKFQC